MQLITIDGNCTAEPEQRYNNDGKASATLNVAVNDSRKNSEGEWEEVPHYFRVHVTERRVKYIMERATKGTQVFATGRLSIGEYKAKDGTMKPSYDVWATDVSLGARTLAKSERSYQDDEDRAPVAAKGGNGKPKSMMADEDLPFFMPRHIQEPWLNWTCP